MHELQAGNLAPMAVIVRDGLNESFHHGVAVLVNPMGEVLEQAGDIDALIYPRSALKPLQALTLYRLGLRLPSKQTVMSMASHYSTEVQVSEVRAMLEGAKVSESELGCPPALPWNPEAKAKVTEAKPIFHNCSGKHSGFLAACSHKNWDRESYLALNHPLQLAIKELIEEFSSEAVEKTTIDGCGAPLHALSTLGLARAISRFSLEGRELVEPALANPNLIGDVTTPDAAFLRAGLFSKLGAEGVFTVATESGHAVAIKIADGSLRAAGLIALQLLSRQGLVDGDQHSQIATDCKVEVLGGGKSVGELQVLI